MKKFLLLTSILFSFFYSFAQNARLKGRLEDTTNYRPMAYSSIVLIRVSDSMLVDYTRADNNGEFELKEIKPGQYTLQVLCPTFVDYEETIELKENETKDMGVIRMLTRANLLKEVIIREQKDAIRIRGDTTEFVVDSFLTNKNSNVEDLLKKLPGIQVDKNGKITAQGQEVKRVLVDGEEFFGEDPTVATRNLKATNVETVQVFDKKSDQSTLSGIDDGTKEKTINLTLKDDAKKGYFGKVSGGLGTDNRYEHEGMLNAFNKKRKISVYGAASNTNKTSLNWEDANKYSGGSGEVEVDDNGNTYMYYYGSDENVDFNGTGIPETWYVGTHYSNKFKDDKHSIAFNGTRKAMTVQGYDNNYTQYILPDTLYYNNQYKLFNNYRDATALSGNYEWKTDSLSTIKLKFSGRQGTSRIDNRFTSENLNAYNMLVNSNTRKSTSDGTNEMLRTSLTWNRKFRTQGRSLSLTFAQDYSNNASDAFINSQTDYYDSTGAVARTELFDQKKTTDQNTQTYSAKGVYTEPLSKTWFVVSDYSVSTTQNKSARYTFSRAGNNEYTDMVDSLSNDFRYNVLTQKGGLALRYVAKKLNYSFGGRISYTDLQQNNVVNNTHQSQYFVNLFPSARINYKIKNTTNITLNYDGNTQQPSLQQIQPIQDNTNPLDIYVGNPQLKQSFRNTFSMNYSSYKPLTEQSIYLSLRHFMTNDEFTSNDVVDQFGKKTHQTVNVNGNYTTSFYSYYYHSFKKIHTSIGGNMSGSINKNTNFINNARNVNNYQNFTIGPDIYYSIEEKFETGLRTDFTYNHNTSSLRPDVVTKYWIQTYDVYTEFYLPKKFTIEADCGFNIRQRTSEFDRNLNTIIFNASISKRFFEKYPLEVKISGNDLLKQNVGFSRTANSNYINENTHTVLQRYFMLTLTWNFNKGPGSEQGND